MSSQEGKHGLSETEMHDFKEIFNVMDRDKGGKLEVGEFRHLIDMLGLKVRSDDLDSMFSHVDADGSGQVDFEEFLQVMTQPQALPYKRRDVLRAFEHFREGTEPEGCINAETLKQALITHCSDKNPPEEVARLVQSLELTGDGNNLIDYKSKVDIFINK